MSLTVMMSALHYLAEIGLWRVFRQWLQLVHCTNYYAGLSISRVVVHSQNLIGTECSLKEVSVELSMKQAKSISNGWNSEYRGFQ